MPNTNNDSDIPERIAAARREAEALKERIKQRKEALADTTCKFFCFSSLRTPKHEKSNSDV